MKMDEYRMKQKIPTVNKETLKLQCYTADSLFTRYIYSSQAI